MTLARCLVILAPELSPGMFSSMSLRHVVWWILRGHWWEGHQVRRVCLDWKRWTVVGPHLGYCHELAIQHARKPDLIYHGSLSVG